MVKTAGFFRRAVLATLALFLLVSISSCGKEEPEIPDPHAGQVNVYDGYGYVWMTPLEGVERNSFAVDQFSMQDDTPVYIGSDYTVLKGIDVSEHQLEIDWNQVGQEDLDFVFIRCGRRGYTQGGLYEDEYFRQNIAGAKAAGLKVGIYFATQATTVAEAIEEAQYTVDLLKDYSIDLPVAYDWEKMYTDEARAENLDVTTLTDCAVAFCETVKAAGYTPAVYYNRTIGYYRYDLTRLTPYTVWFSLPVTPPDVTFPSFLYHLDIWQYSISGTLPGIPTEVDFDYFFLPKILN